MVSSRRQKDTLTKKEQSTTTAYKMMSERIKNLEESLKKTQDESEKIHSEKYEIEKRNIILEEKLKDQKLITVLEFIASAVFGFSLSFLQQRNWSITLEIGIPSLLVYIVCAYLTRK